MSVSEENEKSFRGSMIAIGSGKKTVDDITAYAESPMKTRKRNRKYFVARIASQLLVGGIGLWAVIFVGYHIFLFYSYTDMYYRRGEITSEKLISSLEIKYGIQAGFLRKDLQPMAVYLQESVEDNKGYLEGIGYILFLLACSSLICVTYAIDDLLLYRKMRTEAALPDQRESPDSKTGVIVQGHSAEGKSPGSAVESGVDASLSEQER